MRKLALASTSFSIGIILAHYFIPVSFLVYFSAAFGLLAVAAMLLKKRILSSVLLFACVAIMLYWGHDALTVGRVERLASDNMQAKMVVISEVNDYGSYSSVRVKMDSKPFRGMQANLYNYNGTLDVKPGDIISADCKIKPADTRYGEQVDYNVARGIYIKAYVKNTIEITGRKYTPSVIGTIINSYFRNAAAQLFDGSERAFITALMLGNKTELYADTDTYMALSRSGFMHTVAVSGMHVAFVAAVILLIFGGGITGSVICITVIWLFVLITGFSPSAVRAAFMQTVLIAAKFFNRENDSITSLSFALACILINNPFAIASVSLQMSFAAVLGLCLFENKMRQIVYTPVKGAKGIKRVFLKALKYISGVCTASVSVMIFTVPLSIYYFGYVSLLSFLMNILCLWAIPICFGAAYLACFVISFAPAVASIIAWAISYLIRYILAAAKCISGIKAAIIYFDLPILKWWVVLTVVCALICAFSKINRRYKIIIPVFSSLLCLILVKLIIFNTFTNKLDSYNIIDVGQGQCVVAMSGNNTIMVDCGNQDAYFSNAGDTAAAFLYSRERNKIDVLYFTHLHSDHSNGFDHLSSLIDIKAVVIPEVSADDEFYDELIDICTAKDIEVMYNNSAECSVYNNLTVSVFPSDENDSVNESCMKLLFSDNDFDMLITGDISAKVEKSFVKTYEFPETELIIAAHHGSRYSSCGDYLSAIGGQYAVISCGANNYGHPTYETLERLRAYGYNIYRTDLNGTVSFYIRG